MNKQLQPIKNEVTQPIDKNKLVSIEKFQSKLNSQPDTNNIKINKYGGNSKYLPISFHEMTLDEMFFGHWHTENFQYQVVANELIGSIEVVFLHPVSGYWLRRTGAAAVPIQMNKGSKVLDVENKIINTLVKDFPHLKSSCISNAARSIGKLFGRDLNREFNDTYQPIVLPSHLKEVDSIAIQFENAQTIKDLERIFEENQNKILTDSGLVAKYKLLKNQLSL